MAGRIPDTVLEDILSRADIIEVISGYMPLKRAGRNYKAHCPFHHEKTPSFMVSPARQIYHCFGCGAGGNVFNFLMQYERLEFREAVEVLAKKAGVVIPETHKEDAGVSSLITQLLRVNEMASNFFEIGLSSASGMKARAYVAKRGISETTIRDFKLGYAPDRWDGLINHLRAKNVSLGLLEKAGLVLSREDGGYYDRFRNRIMFPIFDIKSRPIGFGARVLEETTTDTAKYMNSPETPLYSKGKNLYGLHVTKDAIRENDYAIIVEGYLDFILPYQHGLRNIVASLGTALTADQVRMIKRYTHTVVMIYDPDAAGQLATLRSLDIFLEEDMEVRVVSLPQGYDPDLFVRTYGIEALKNLVQSAANLFDYQLKVLGGRYNIRDPQGKRRIFDEMLPLIKKVPNAILRSEYIKNLSEQAEVPEFEVREQLNKIKETRPFGERQPLATAQTTDTNPTEKLLMQLMLEENQIIQRLRGVLKPADFQDKRISRVVSLLFELVEQGKDIEASTIINQLRDEGIAQCIHESSFLPELSLEEKERVVDDCIRRLKSKSLRLKRQALHDQIRAAQKRNDEVSMKRLVEEFHCLMKYEVTPG